MEYNNFEAGEGKTVLDTHVAHISDKIVRWVRVGNDLVSGVQLSDLIGVSVCVLCCRIKMIVLSCFSIFIIQRRCLQYDASLAH